MKKTSNIILVIFFLLVFITPFLIALALKAKVNKGEFTRKKENVNPYDRKFQTGKYSVLYLNGKPNKFICSVIIDDSSYLEYRKMGNDSLHFFTNNDTLTVYYTTEEPANYWTDIKVHTTSLSSITANNANVIFLANGRYTQDQLDIKLKNSAAFSVSPGGMLSGEVRKVDSNHVDIKKLQIESDASEIDFDQVINIGQLSMHLRDHSTLKIPSGFKFTSFAGEISDDTQIIGTWNSVKYLKRNKDAE